MSAKQQKTKAWQQENQGMEYQGMEYQFSEFYNVVIAQLITRREFLEF